MIINGKQLAQEIENDLSAKFKTLPYKKVVFVMFGDNAASRQFMGIKSRVAEQIGINAEIKIFPESVTTEEAVSIVAELSNHYDGVVVQLPLPSHLDVEQVLNAVPAEKDIDVLGSISLQQYKQGISNRVPPVAAAVHYVLDYHNMTFNDEKIVIVGHGKLVGQPVACMFDRMNIPYKIITIETLESDKIELLKNADIIISGAGVSHMIKPDMVKAGVVLIDAGTSEQSGKLVGDIDPECASKALLMTPVPGGVGPITVVSLFKNLL
jgi:methylenetetrahydrofolate dehydrogenase (NADP+)/methenyltetrahydrofolate cyclohydrolase